MPPSLSSPSPAPGPSQENPFARVADAIYHWSVAAGDSGNVFTQDDIFASRLIPDNNINVLFEATKLLVARRLFKIHDVKGTSGIAWEVVSREDAANYDDLSRDEQLVYGLIDSVGAAGIWTKTIKAKTNLHQKVVEKAHKSLESKGLIKQMRNVKYPGRKMYILAKLQPSEDATGGSWYTNGELDVELMENVSDFIEASVARLSWIEVKPHESEETISQKRKAPSDGFDPKGKGKAKAFRMNDDRPVSAHPESKVRNSNSKSSMKKTFRPYPAGHKDYPTAYEITKLLNDKKAVDTILPQNAVLQLLEVMVYDDKLRKLHRPPVPGIAHEEQEAAESDSGQVTMFKSLKKPDQVRAEYDRKQSLTIGPSKANREVELEDIGIGGATEIPCLRCPVFDICEDGGPVNAQTCTYFDDWWQKMEQADNETEDDAGEVELVEGEISIS